MFKDIVSTFQILTLHYDNSFYGINLHARLYYRDKGFVFRTIRHEYCSMYLMFLEEILELFCNFLVRDYSYVFIPCKRNNLHISSFCLHFIKYSDPTKKGIRIRIFWIRNPKCDGSLNVCFPPYYGGFQFCFFSQVIVPVNTYN